MPTCTPSASAGGGAVSQSLRQKWDSEQKALDNLIKARTGRFETEDGIEYEKQTVTQMKSWVFNPANNLTDKDYGLSEGESLSVRYKNGAVDVWGDGEVVKLSQPKSQIDSMIYSGEGGYTFAGKNVEFTNYAELDTGATLNRMNREIRLENDRIDKGYSKGKKHKEKSSLTLNDFGKGEHSDWRVDFKKE